MKRLALSLALLLTACATPAPTDPSTARIDTGLLKGVTKDGVTSFKGVPFAAPPVGDLRWRAPQPAAKWDSVREANAYGDICTQKMPNPDNGIGQYPASEDCLTLNVFTTNTSRNAKQPVMLWIHGGGFVNGSGSAELYDGTQMAKHGVVLISINYRLGRFGSFAHPLLTAEAKGGLTGNYGLMDQIAALEWTKRNAASFGGDPNNVTIFGESAGGMAVQQLIVSPNARGLFHKAIVQSGAGREIPTKLADAETGGETFIKSLGVVAPNTTALRAIPAERILAAGDPPPSAGGGPIADGRLYPMPVAEAFAQGKEAQVPYLVGANGAEFPSPPDRIDAALARFSLTPEKRAALEKLYDGPEDFAAKVAGDIIFGEPAHHLAGLHARTQPTWLYRFDVVSQSVRHRLKGTTHAQERQYVFDTLHTSPYATDANDKVQAQYAIKYWTNFAKTGDPNGAGLPAWPKYSAASDQLLEFTNDGPVAKPTPNLERYKLITAR